MPTIRLIPAYGRDYVSKREVEGSLKGGHDFKIADFGNSQDGRYINLPQIKEAGYTEINVRYSQMRKVTVLKTAKLEETT